MAASSTSASVSGFVFLVHVAFCLGAVLVLMAGPDSYRSSGLCPDPSTGRGNMMIRPVHTLSCPDPYWGRGGSTQAWASR